MSRPGRPCHHTHSQHSGRILLGRPGLPKGTSLVPRIKQTGLHNVTEHPRQAVHWSFPTMTGGDRSLRSVYFLPLPALTLRPRHDF
jgi:hypothetical protein